MMHSQYCRLESKAGGCLSSNRDFIRACHSVLTKKGRSYAARIRRHIWLRDGLAQKHKAINQYLSVVSGRINHL